MSSKKEIKKMKNIILTSVAKVKTINKQIVIESNSTKLKIDPTSIESFLVLHNGCSITSHAIELMSKNSVVLIFCDEKNLPVCALESFSQHSRYTEFALMQIEAFGDSKVKKTLWKKLLTEKLLNQKSILHILKKEVSFFNMYENDPVLNEGVIASFYFKEIFGESFNRRDEENRINYYLNFCYGIIRSKISHQLTIRGLMPQLGVGHKSVYNRLNLVYDLIEPYRPIIDYYVFAHLKELNQAHYRKDYVLEKKILIEILNISVLERDATRDICVNVENFVKDFKKAWLFKENINLRTPTPNFENDFPW